MGVSVKRLKHANPLICFLKTHILVSREIECVFSVPSMPVNTNACNLTLQIKNAEIS